MSEALHPMSPKARHGPPIHLGLVRPGPPAVVGEVAVAVVGKGDVARTGVRAGVAIVRVRHSVGCRAGKWHKRERRRLFATPGPQLSEHRRGTLLTKECCDSRALKVALAALSLSSCV